MPEPHSLDLARPAPLEPSLPPQADTLTAPPSAAAAPVADAAQPNAASPNNGTGRDARGRFAKGNLGGPGNPFTRQSAAFRKALCDTLSADDIHALTRTLLDKAKGGDVAAIKLLFAYTIGRPADAVNPDTLDVDELQCFRQQTLPPDMPMPPPVGVPTALACQVLRGLMPAREDAMRQALADRLREDLEKKERQQAAAAANPPQPGPAPRSAAAPRPKTRKQLRKERYRRKQQKIQARLEGQARAAQRNGARPPNSANRDRPPMTNGDDRVMERIQAEINGAPPPKSASRDRPPMTNGDDRVMERIQAEINGASRPPRRRR
jgi:hypothetical protein